MLWALLGFRVVVLVYLFLIAPKVLHRKARTRLLRGVPYAHRGLHGKGIPENSLTAFQRAVDRGYGIELDVHLTRDGQLVVHHDDSLSRMCHVNRNIESMTLDEILDCRLWGTDEKIPTLDQALNVVQGRVPLIVEMKSAGEGSKALPEALYRRMRQYDGDWCVESFDPRLIRWFKRYAPSVIRGQLAYDPSKVPQDQHRGLLYWMGARLLMNCISRPDFVAYGYETEGNLSFRVMRMLFQPVLAAWTVRSRKDFERLKDQYDLQIFESFEP